MAVLLKKYFLNLAVAHSKFILDGWVQLFWAAFDMPMTVVPLEVALGYKKKFVCFKKQSWKLTYVTLA